MSPAGRAAQQVVQQVQELPDRTSPDDWPDAMLVTSDELAKIVTEAISQAEEAARREEREAAQSAVCADCRKGQPVVDTPGVGWEHLWPREAITLQSSESTWPCRAAAIRSRGESKEGA